MTKNQRTTETAFWDMIHDFQGRFVLYGCGRFGSLVMDALLEKGARPVAVCDGDPARRGTQFYGMPILSPGEAGAEYGVADVFLVAIYVEENSKRFKDIQASLVQAGCARVVFLPQRFYAYFYLTRNPSGNEERHFGKDFFHGLTLKNGAFFAMDQQNSDCVVKDGERRTCGGPVDPLHDVFIIGNSLAFSVGLPDEDTLASHIQAVLDADPLLQKYRRRVRNFGSQTPFVEHLLLQTMAMDMKPGDCVVAITHGQWGTVETLCDTLVAAHRHCLEKGCSFAAVLIPFPGMMHTFPEYLLAYRSVFEETGVFRFAPETHAEERDRLLEECGRIVDVLQANGCPASSPLSVLDHLERGGTPAFIDLIHLGSRGNREVAEYFCRTCLAFIMQYQDIRPGALHAIGVRKIQTILSDQCARGAMREVREWVDTVAKVDARENKRTGAIVMNCNPFTNGHLHLVKTAAEMVDALYVFVVEEDCSEYAFADRLTMAKECAGAMDNVIVIPGGRFVISSVTFQEYFGKSVAAGKVDPSFDVAVFGAVIAPELGITIRFVGEEPLCAVTRQYNETMASLLPPMGVAVHVIPRLAQGHEPVSASRVRSLVKDADWAAVRELVPDAAYRILRNVSPRV